MKRPGTVRPAYFCAHEAAARGLLLISSLLKNLCAMKNLFLTAMLAAIATMLLLACRKDKEVPTPPQHKNTFTCLLNGQRWEPCAKENAWLCFLCPPDPEAQVYLPDPETDSTTVELYFHKKCDSLFQTIRMTLFHINNDLSIESASMYYRDFYTNCNAGHYSPLGFTIKVTRFDSGILSGFFEGNLIDEECQDTILVESGHFDFKVGY